MDRMNPTARLSGARVLVTGATGFLGAHVVLALVREGADVYAIRTSDARVPRLTLPPVTWLTTDIVDGEGVSVAVRQANPDIAIHLAAYGASSADRDAHRMFEVNVKGSWNLLRALPPALRFVMTGTCAEYGDVEGSAHEELTCRPKSGYAATKHAAVNLARADARETGRPVVVLRPYGPFGPGDDPLRVLPAAIAGLIDGHDVALGNGTQVRDFSYVDDHVEAIICAATASELEPGAVFNIGTGQGLTIRAALERVATIVKGPGRLVFGAIQTRPDDLVEMVPDVAAARRDLGFQVRTPFDEGVVRTAAFVRAQRDPRSRPTSL